MSDMRQTDLIVRLLLATLILVTQGCCPSISGPNCPPVEECLLASDYQQLPRPRLVGQRSSFRDRFEAILNGFLAGVGDRFRTGLTGKKGSVVLHKWARKNGAPVNAQAIWLTRDWNESWVSRRDLQRMAEEGVVPVLILYYWGDEISRENVVRQRKDWYFYLLKVAAIAAIDYPVLVVLEPEFNDESNHDKTLILSWPGFNEIVIDGIYILRSLAPNVLVGICPGDFGKQDLESSIGEVAEYSDFIAYQEMRASTKPSLITDDYEDVTDRALGYATWLHETFGKPVLLSYVAVSTYDPEHGKWEQHQADVVSHLYASAPQLQAQGVFGILYFMLFDDPKHFGYFGPAEPYFGLVDSSGQPKKGWWTFAWHIKNIEDKLTKFRR